MIGCSLALGLALATAGAVAADGYPSRLVTVIVPFAAGGTVDKVARQIQEPLRARLGQQVMVDNRGGAGGTIGMAALAKSAPDGYTVALVFDSYATEQHIYPKLPYATLRDFAGVSYVARSPMVLVVPAGSPHKSLKDYVAAAKVKGAVSYASVGAGSSNHLAAELFHETAGSQGLHVPFKGGGPALTDLMGGHVDSMIASLPLVLQQVQSGKLRALAVTSAKRNAALPEVPAVAETYKGFEVYSWVGMVAPAKTPAPVLDRLSADMTATLRDPEVAKRLSDGGFEVVAGDRKATDQLIRSESERWGRLIQARKIVAE
ncbi:tripartite tricarboxylate transporter substrate binding protein [Variovorax saccharolyticus]|uniref:tripartite tricarboxylate transporter substrate binding protein n=1 Tax=Variovorax saccharolyticus TaxID=3053516 RepID=UPI00257871B1|nr:tripartite tricarboxylate transporter substrate binding protein [Variovorax sp. J22R187]MDM0019582.1 tripartite tricarboxylate transporter substrate binding protein [Variovorax sp. J22R187]